MYILFTLLRHTVKASARWLVERNTGSDVSSGRFTFNFKPEQTKRKVERMRSVLTGVFYLFLLIKLYFCFKFESQWGARVSPGRGGEAAGRPRCCARSSVRVCGLRWSDTSRWSWCTVCSTARRTLKTSSSSLTRWVALNKNPVQQVKLISYFLFASEHYVTFTVPVCVLMAPANLI